MAIEPPFWASSPGPIRAKWPYQRRSGGPDHAGVEPHLDAEQFGRAWVAAWNAHDLDAVLAHYDPNIRFVSPVAARLGTSADGQVTGIEGLRAYFAAALARAPELRFDLDATFAGVGSVAILYRNHRGQRAAETMVLRDGLVISGRAHYERTSA